MIPTVSSRRDACMKLAAMEQDRPDWKQHWLLTAKLLRKFGVNVIFMSESTRH